MFRFPAMPVSLMRLLKAFRTCFTSCGFDTFTALVTGLEPVSKLVRVIR
jgi:hypothetical protein